jgi:hypothetical protein
VKLVARRFCVCFVSVFFTFGVRGLVESPGGCSREIRFLVRGTSRVLSEFCMVS